MDWPSGSFRKWLLNRYSLGAHAYKNLNTAKDSHAKTHRGERLSKHHARHTIPYVQIFTLTLFCSRFVSWMKGYSIHRCVKNYRFHLKFFFCMCQLLYSWSSSPLYSKLNSVDSCWHDGKEPFQNDCSNYSWDLHSV